LITTGPFAHVRNPLYLGNLLIYAGIGVMSYALWPWLVIVALAYFVVQYTLIVSLEEEHLASAFGDEYDRYRASVGRFVPRFSPYGAGRNEQPELDWKRGFVSERRTLQALTVIVAILAVRWILET